MPAEAWGFLGVIVGAFISVATTYVANSLQSEAENRRWVREQQHQLYLQIVFDLTSLVAKLVNSRITEAGDVVLHNPDNFIQLYSIVANLRVFGTYLDHDLGQLIQTLVMRDFSEAGPQAIEKWLRGLYSPLADIFEESLQRSK